MFTASFEPKGGEVVVSEATTCVIAAAPPSTATSSCLCYLWVLWTRTRDEDAIPFDLLTSASNLSATTAFTFHLEFQRRRTKKNKKFSSTRHHCKAHRRNSLCNIVHVASPSAIVVKLIDADCSVAPWSSRCHLPLCKARECELFYSAMAIASPFGVHHRLSPSVTVMFNVCHLLTDVCHVHPIPSVRPFLSIEVWSTDVRPLPFIPIDAS